MTTKRNKHKTLGEVAPAKHFGLRRRMPGWRPDEIDHKSPCGGDRPPGPPAPPGPPNPPDVEVLFPEEALLADASKVFCKFEPQAIGAVPPALEWVLGRELLGSSHSFDGRLLKLQGLLQAYNRALYELRRMHLKADGVPDAHNMKPLDPATTPARAEDNWTKAVTDLSRFLEAGNGSGMILDVVEVNKYIVSVRVIEKDSSIVMAASGLRPKELSGSSSSHIRIPIP